MQYEPPSNESWQSPPPRQHNEFYLAAWRRTFDFTGVASRTEFWSFFLVNLVIGFGIGFLIGFWIAFTGNVADLEGTLGPVSLLFWIVLIIPTLSVSIRRVRDVTGSGWWFLLAFIPFVGGLIVLVICILPSRQPPRPQPSQDWTRRGDGIQQADRDDPWR